MIRVLTMRSFARILSAALVAAGIAACSNPTSPETIQAHRADWEAHRLVNYDYTYEYDGGNVSGPSGQPLRVQVRQDTVRSVVLLADGTQLTPAYWPTIEKLFDRALSAAQDGSLAHITFDPVLAYPTIVDYVPRPDVIAAEHAGALQAPP